MRTTLTIDDILVQDLMQSTGEKNPVAAIKLALRDYLATMRKQKLLALRGQVQIEDNWRQLRQLDTAL
jgi:Arc/MetJ family transcription regulator